jgi:hypothetical protein
LTIIPDANSTAQNASLPDLMLQQPLAQCFNRDKAARADL